MLYDALINEFIKQLGLYLLFLIDMRWISFTAFTNFIV